MTVNLHKGYTPRKGKQHCVSDVSVFEGWRGWFQDKCRWLFSLLTQFRRKHKKPGPLLLVYFMIAAMCYCVDRDSLFRSLGGQRRRPGANYRKKFGHVVVFFTVYWLLFLVARCRVQAQFLARVGRHLSWQKFLNPSQKNPAKYSFCDGQVCTR